MKISDIKIYTMDAFRTNWAFIKVETDEGLYGWGEATLGTQEMSLEGCVADYKRLIVGRDPLEVERMLFEVYRDSYWKGGPVMMSALAGIEIACCGDAAMVSLIEALDFAMTAYHDECE